MGKLDEDRLNTELSKLGYESVTIKSVGKGVGGSRKVAVEATSCTQWTKRERTSSTSLSRSRSTPR